MCRCDNFFYHLLLDTYRHYPLNENVRITLQLEGSKYFPVTYCSKECFASGAKEGWVMAASVTNPATDTDTTNMPPKKKIFFIRLPLHMYYIVIVFIIHCGSEFVRLCCFFCAFE